MANCETNDDKPCDANAIREPTHICVHCGWPDSFHAGSLQYRIPVDLEMEIRRKYSTQSLEPTRGWLGSLLGEIDSLRARDTFKSNLTARITELEGALRRLQVACIESNDLYYAHIATEALDSTAHAEQDLGDIYARNAYLAQHAKQTVIACADWMNGTLTTAINLIAEGSFQEAKRRLKLALLDGPPDVKVTVDIGSERG